MDDEEDKENTTHVTNDGQSLLYSLYIKSLGIWYLHFHVVENSDVARKI